MPCQLNLTNWVLKSLTRCNCLYLLTKRQYHVWPKGGSKGLYILSPAHNNSRKALWSQGSGSDPSVIWAVCSPVLCSHPLAWSASSPSAGRACGRGTGGRCFHPCHKAHPWSPPHWPPSAAYQTAGPPDMWYLQQTLKHTYGHPHRRILNTETHRHTLIQTSTQMDRKINIQEQFHNLFKLNSTRLDDEMHFYYLKGLFSLLTNI